LPSNVSSHLESGQPGRSALRTDLSAPAHKLKSGEWEPTARARAGQLAAERKTQREISQVLGVPTATVGSWVGEGRRASNLQVHERARQLAVAGKTQTEISHELEIPPSTVASWAEFQQGRAAARGRPAPTAVVDQQRIDELERRFGAIGARGILSATQHAEILHFHAQGISTREIGQHLSFEAPGEEIGRIVQAARTRERYRANKG
jgi:transposase-like protein